MSILTATFKSKGKEYSLSLDTDKPDHNYEDENYSEWFVTEEDGRILDVTVWKDEQGRFTNDAVVEIYDSYATFGDDELLDKKYIKLKRT